LTILDGPFACKELTALSMLLADQKLTPNPKDDP
jgi:hypothetical protein